MEGLGQEIDGEQSGHFVGEGDDGQPRQDQDRRDEDQRLAHAGTRGHRAQAGVGRDDMGIGQQPDIDVENGQHHRRGPRCQRAGRQRREQVADDQPLLASHRAGCDGPRPGPPMRRHVTGIGMGRGRGDPRAACVGGIENTEPGRRWRSRSARMVS